MKFLALEGPIIYQSDVKEAIFKNAELRTSGIIIYLSWQNNNRRAFQFHCTGV